MNATRRTALALTASALLTMVSLPVRAASPDEAAIRRTLDRYEQALNQADAAAAAALYTSDGVRMAPDIPTAVGQEALKASHEGTFRAVQLDLKFTVDEILPLGPDTALLRSRSVGRVKVNASPDPAKPAAFKELFVLRRQADGQWKFSHYAFSTAPLDGP